MRRNVTIAAGIAVIAVAFGLYNAYNLSKINSEYQQKLINESKVLAATALDVLEEGDSKTAALIAMEGIATEDNDRPFVSDTVYALSQALGTYDLGTDLSHDLILQHDVAVDDFSINDDGDKVISVDNNNTIYIWDLGSGECTFKKVKEYVHGESDDIKDVGFSGDKAIVVSNDTLAAYSYTGEAFYEKTFEDSITFANISKDGKYIVVDGSRFEEGTLKSYDFLEILDASTGEVLKSYDNQVEFGYGNNVTINEDGTKLLINHVSSSDEVVNYVTLVDLQTDQLLDIALMDSTIMGMTFTEDGDFAVYTMGYNALISGDNAPMHLMKCDGTTGETKWTKELQYYRDILSSSYSYLRSRVNEVDGTKYAQLI